MQAQLVARALKRLIAASNISPVLIDIGASGSPPTLWKPLRASATYIGFDPDRRDFSTETDGPFARTIHINKAVSTTSKDVTFHLTRSPHCSSTLPPETAALQVHWFAPYFDVENTTTVEAMRLDDVLDQMSTPQVHWIKLDTQGTDLRIIKSLSPGRMDHLMAIDVEPGLIHAYQGEDMFTTTHEALLEAGFWLADLNTPGTPRIHQDTLTHICDERNIDGDILGHGLKAAPDWCEAKYLRSVESLVASDAPPQLYHTLAVFSAVHGHWGHAMDVLLAAPDDGTGMLARLDEIVKTELGRLTRVHRRRRPGMKLVEAVRSRLD